MEQGFEAKMVWVDLEDVGLTLEDFVRVAWKGSVVIFANGFIVHY